ACAIVKDNLSSLDVSEGFQVLQMDFAAAMSLLERDGAVLDIAFLDPPYDREDLYTKALELFGSRPLMNDGILVIDHSNRLALPEHDGSLEKYRSIVHGDSGLTFYRKA